MNEERRKETWTPKAVSNSNTVLFETIVCLLVTWPVFVRHVVRSTGPRIPFVIQITKTATDGYHRLEHSFNVQQCCPKTEITFL